MIGLFVFFFLAVTISFLCSLLEAVILSLSHTHIALLVEEGRPSGHILKGFKEKIDRPLSAILTLNTVANTVGAAGVGAKALAVFGDAYVALFSGLLTLSILVFSEIIPKTLGAVFWKQLAPAAAYLIKALVTLTYPFVVAFELLGNLITPRGPKVEVTREEVALTAEMGRAAGQLEDRERSVIKNLLHLKNIPVRDIMTPRSVMFALPKTQTVAQTVRQHASIHFSRIPVFGRDLDDILGLVRRYQINQAFSQGEEGKALEELVSPLKVVPGTKAVADVLNDFIKQREHIFLVVDEYGGTQGIITLEDAIETLLGVEIVDELDWVDDMQKYALEKWEKKKRARQVEN